MYIVPGAIMHAVIDRHCMKCGLTPKNAEVMVMLEKKEGDTQKTEPEVEEVSIKES